MENKILNKEKAPLVNKVIINSSKIDFFFQIVTVFPPLCIYGLVKDYTGIFTYIRFFPILLKRLYLQNVLIGYSEYETFNTMINIDAFSACGLQNMIVDIENG